MIAALKQSGWIWRSDPADADVILVNSCGFIEPAKQESIDVTLSFIESYPDALVVMTGCLSQRYSAELAEEMPELAGVIGNRAPERITEFMKAIRAGEGRVFVPEGAIRRHPRELLSLSGTAYLKVAEGCDNRCAFCAIPQIRGRMRSKPPGQVVEEAEELLSHGVREINLVAQDLASYGRDLGVSPIDLLSELDRFDGPLGGEYWVRLLYVYPEHFQKELIDVVGSSAHLLPYFDIPFQHASPTVLRRMGRPGDATTYLELISDIRTRLPDAVVRSTFLVGFFGESDDDFARLTAFQDRAEIDWLGVFPYSAEEGTPALAGGARPDVPKKVAQRRADEVMARQQAITHRRIDRFVGRDLPVLVEEMIPEEALAIGRCYAQAPDVDGAVVVNVPDDARSGLVNPGSFVHCRIIRRNGLDLEAVPL
jgi:ribosomal protein S12 methylthiotransferase